MHAQLINYFNQVSDLPLMVYLRFAELHLKI